MEDSNNDQLEEAAPSQLAALRQLLKSPGWELLVKHAQAQIQTRTDTVILTPLESTGKVTQQEFQKGEIAGMRLLIALPESLIETVKAILDKQQRENDESENIDPKGGNAP